MLEIINSMAWTMEEINSKFFSHRHFHPILISLHICKKQKLFPFPKGSWKGESRNQISSLIHYFATTRITPTNNISQKFSLSNCGSYPRLILFNIYPQVILEPQNLKRNGPKLHNRNSLSINGRIIMLIDQPVTIGVSQLSALIYSFQT